MFPLTRSTLLLTVFVIGSLMLVSFASPMDQQQDQGISESTQEDSEKTVERIRKLIQGLNDDSFQLREESEKELSRMGKAALKPIQEATRSSSAEVRFRAERILRRIELNIRLERVVNSQPPLKELSVVVLDNCDPDFKGDLPREDSLRFLTEAGKPRFVSKRFNNCEAIGINHGIAVDPKRARIYIREFVGKKVTAFDPNGTMVFETRDVPRPYALAVDSQTGHVWCLSSGHGNQDGQIVVISSTGEHVSTFAVDGFDITFNPHDETFWVVGQEVTKIDRDGRILFTSAGVKWRYVAVAANPKDGSVWVVERKHTMTGGRNRLARFNRDGKMVQSLELAKAMPMDVACDPVSGTAWIVDFRNQILRVPMKGKPLPKLPIAARSVAIGRKSGRIWVATDQSILRLNREGQTLAEHPLDRPSSQTWLAAY